jgi:hypothetical protein
MIFFGKPGSTFPDHALGNGREKALNFFLQVPDGLAIAREMPQ